MLWMESDMDRAPGGGSCSGPPPPATVAAAGWALGN